MKDSIIIYSSLTCPRCKMLKMELNKKGVEYVDYNIENDPAKQEELGIKELPIISANGKIFGMKEAKEWIRGL